MKTAHHGLRIILGAFLLTVVAACSGPVSEPEPTNVENPYSADEMELHRLAALTNYAKTRGIPEPTPVPDPVRWVAPEDEMSSVVSCMKANGYDAELLPDGGLKLLGVAGQAEAQAADLYRCHAEYPVDPNLVPSAPSNLADLYYEYYTGELSDCLQDAGYVVERPPTLESFREAFDTGNTWNPYDAVVASNDFDDNTWQALQVKCPQELPIGK